MPPRLVASPAPRIDEVTGPAHRGNARPPCPARHEPFLIADIADIVDLVGYGGTDVPEGAPAPGLFAMHHAGPLELANSAALSSVSQRPPERTVAVVEASAPRVLRLGPEGRLAS